MGWVLIILYLNLIATVKMLKPKVNCFIYSDPTKPVNKPRG